MRAKTARALIKSPIDLVVGTLRQLGMHPSDAIPFAVAAAGMGQNLFAPPNVRGWPGRQAWINSSSLLARKQFLDRLLRADAVAANAPSGEDAMSAAASPPAAAVGDTERVRAIRFLRAVDRSIRSVQFDSTAWVAQWKSTADARARDDAIVRLLFAVPPRTALQRSEPVALLRGLVLDPAYELK